MEQETPNESVRPLFLILDFASTKIVAYIALRFAYFLACAPIFFELFKLGFLKIDFALDLLGRFLFVLDECSVFLAEGLALSSALDVQLVLFIKNRLFVSVW